jgi:tetratricopeptide (TPR) repeat protein
MRVANQVIERRPGHMSVLRAHGLIADTLATTEGFDLHVSKALAMAESAARDWEAIIKLDPSNQIAWNNLAAARQGTAFWSWNMGQIRESQAQWRAGLAVERHVTPSPMIGFTLGISSGYLASQEADSGNHQAAEAALGDGRRLTEWAVRDMPQDSFGRTYVPEMLGFYGFPGSGVGYGGYALPLAAGDYETLRNLARASIKRIEPLKADDAQRELDKTRLLETAYRTAALASYHLKDDPAADAEIKRALELRRIIPKRNLLDERDATDARMLAAMIAARMERYSEAQQIVEPVLKFHRELYARGKDNEDLTQHVEFARALYVSALAAPGQKTTELAQAAAILDGLPPAMRRLISNARLRDAIAEERTKRH